MTRTSVYLGLALWGLIIYLFPFDGLMQFLSGIGAVALLGLCVMGISYILTLYDNINRNIDD